MNIRIQYEDLFKNKLVTGISLFTGAGFSVLESPSGEKLPTGTELCDELIEKFSLTDVDKEDGLSYVSEFCVESEYQNYLRERFTVKEYNRLYNAITKINLKTVVTTNIDNIIRRVVDESDNYYIQNIREYGASKNSKNELVYIPLHRDVAVSNSKLFFSKFDLSEVDEVNNDLFSQMFAKLADTPVLFWGYGFNDSGVLKVVKELIEKWNTNIWVQIMPGDDKNKKLFESKGCNIIEADTESLLLWIEQNIENSDQRKEAKENYINLKQYTVPSLTQVATTPTNEYYQQGATDWYPILIGETVERSLASEAENLAIKNKNVIISGGIFTGKTTLLMQLARKIDSKNKIYVESLTKEEATFIVKTLKGESAWMFFRNCCRDVDAMLVMANCPNITVVGTSDDYILETVKHILSQNIKYSIVDCNELSKTDAMRIYHKIPEGIRNDSFTYKQSEDEKYSLLEFIANNVRGAFTKQHILSIFDHLYNNDKDSFTIVALASYLSDCGSALSYQNVAHILDVQCYPTAVEKLKCAINYLRQYNIRVDEDDSAQDYYVLRSKFFSLHAKRLLSEKFRSEFGKIVKTFITNESKYNILRFDVFKRKAFDAELFRKLFSYKEAMDIYTFIYERESNPYTLQQCALCRGLFGDYEKAFIDIDKAINMKPTNFSFRNSQAILLFESNHKNFVEGSLNYMKQAMDILEECYSNDKRKIYHSQKFARFSIILYEEYNCTDYLKKAREWLIEMTSSGVSHSFTTKQLIEKLTNILSLIQK